MSMQSLKKIGQKLLKLESGNEAFFSYAPLNFAVSVTKSCPLCNLKIIPDIFMKLHKNMNQH